MSVAQHIRDRAGRFRWMGLLVVWAVFIVMAAVLLVERAGVQYSAGQHKLGMLAANDAVPASSAIARWARYAPERHYELGECRRFAYARHAAG